MANTGRPSFLKRQKEQQRLARAEAKRQARRARKQERLTERDENREDDMLTTAEALGLVPEEADEAKS
jgi:hypothetical protein